MSTIHNPFEILINEVSAVKKLIIELKNQPKKDYTTVYYTRKEVGAILRVSIQTVDNYICKKWITPEPSGPRKLLIHHYQIFNKDQTLKEFKYKRNA